MTGSHLSPLNCISDPQYHGSDNTPGVPRDSEERQTYPDRLHTQATGCRALGDRVMKIKQITALPPLHFIYQQLQIKFKRMNLFICFD